GEAKEQENAAGPEPQVQSDERLTVCSTQLPRKVPDEQRQSHAPGKEPGEMQQPVAHKRHLVVILRFTQSEKAQDMFVDKVEPEEVGVAPPGEQVPRRSDGDKYGQA